MFSSLVVFATDAQEQESVVLERKLQLLQGMMHNNEAHRGHGSAMHGPNAAATAAAVAGVYPHCKYCRLFCTFSSVQWGQSIFTSVIHATVFMQWPSAITDIHADVTAVHRVRLIGYSLWYKSQLSYIIFIYKSVQWYQGRRFVICAAFVPPCWNWPVIGKIQIARAVKLKCEMTICYHGHTYWLRCTELDN